MSFLNRPAMTRVEMNVLFRTGARASRPRRILAWAMLLLLLAAGILIFYPLLHHLPLANLLVVSSHTPTSQVALQALVFTASTVAIAMAFAASWIIIAVVLWAKAIAWAG